MSQAPTITVFVPGVLRAYCGGAAEISLAAPGVREALGQLERDHPALYRNVCDETGTVRRHINLFVNSSHMRDCDGLDTVLAPGDVLTILPAVSGG
ncbi:MAG: MoaD/ThiS family protein [Candidatus Eisenbacteria bacterium]